MLRVGIIGCGSIAKQRHAYEYSKNPNVEIAGFFDLSPQRAKALADQFGGKVYPTSEALIGDPTIDAVSVCVANAFHAGTAIKCLQRGKHVLCEKPMAVTLEDCEKMIAAAKKSGKRLMVDHNQRLAPAHKKAKEILDSGELGRVISFNATFGYHGPEMWSMDHSANTWFFKKSAAAFGSMADLGIHKIDLVRYLIGSDVTTVFAKTAVLDKKFPDGRPIEVDDNTFEILNFANGTVGTVTTSWTHYGEESNSTILYCEKGIMKLYVDPRYTLEIVNADGTHVHFELEHPQEEGEENHVNSGVIDTFVDAILNEKPSILDAEEIVGSMRAVFACLRSAEEERPVMV